MSLRKSYAQTSALWFSSRNPNPKAKLRLFCFPYAGGSDSIYRNWAEGLPKSVEIVTAHLPGRGSRMKEAAFTNIGQLVPALAQAIEPFLDKPFALFGHSMGAIISFELARRLRKQGGPTATHLFASGRIAPHVRDTTRTLHCLPEPEFSEELRRLNGTPKEVLEHPELMQLVTPLLRADFSVVETYSYSPEPPLDCSITAFGGLQDCEVSAEDIKAWREQTTAPFFLWMLRGDHFFLNSAQAMVLRALSQELNRIIHETSLCT